jgi:hypothetical protein
MRCQFFLGLDYGRSYDGCAGKLVSLHELILLKVTSSIFVALLMMRVIILYTEIC